MQENVGDLDSVTERINRKDTETKGEETHEDLFKLEKYEFVKKIKQIVEERRYDDLPHIPVREPVAGEEFQEEFYLLNESGKKSGYLSTELNNKAPVLRQWGTFLQLFREGIRRDPKLRNILVDFMGDKVGQLVPARFMNRVLSYMEGEYGANGMKNGKDERYKKLVRLARRYGCMEDESGTYKRASLGRLIYLEEVPEEIIRPDIRFASRFVDPNKGREYYLKELKKAIKEDNQNQVELFRNLLVDDIYGDSYDMVSKNKIYMHGITGQEKLLVAARYRMARDVKMLALESLFLEIGEIDIKDFAEGKIVTPEDGSSEEGVRVQANLEVLSEEEIASVINPDNWQSILPFKDRAYMISIVVGGEEKKFLLKQRKTGRHMDTKKGGHRPGRTSKREFQVATEFQEQKSQVDDIELRWEVPIGYVEFADSFQFSLFEYVEGGLLKDKFEAEGVLADRIKDHKELFEEDYQNIRQQGNEMRYDPKSIDLIYSGIRLGEMQEEHKRSKKGIRQRVNKVFKRKTRLEQLPELSFEDYARLRAGIMLAKAEYLYHRGMVQAGYGVYDEDGLGFRIGEDEEKGVKLEVIGFDFEYYFKLNEQEMENALSTIRNKQDNFKKAARRGYYPGNIDYRVTQQLALAYMVREEELPSV